MDLKQDSNRGGIVSQIVKKISDLEEFMRKHKTMKHLLSGTQGVTNGDAHDHVGGDGAQIAHTGLSSIGTNTHAQIDTFIGTTAPATYAPIANGVTNGDSHNHVGGDGAALTMAASGLTIASGAITVTGTTPVIQHTIDTEGGAATDDLTTINGGIAGQILVLRTVNSARDVTVKDGAGMVLAGDMVLDVAGDTITLLCITASSFIELARSNNG